MLGRIKRFFQQNIGTIAVGAFVFPLFYRLTTFAARRYLTYQTVKTHDHFRRYKKQRMFEMMEENFEATFQKWYDLMKETIKKNLDAEKYAYYLKNGEGDKLGNWQEMKVIAFANLLTMVYGSSMLTVLLRIQTNVISGLLFKQMEDVPAGLEDEGGAGDAFLLVPESNRIITENLQQEYMVLTRYLCTDGAKHLCELMYEKSKLGIDNLSLKQLLTVADVEELITAVRGQPLRYQPMRLDVDDDEAESNDWCPITEAWYFMAGVKMTKKYIYPPETEQLNQSIQEEFLKTLIADVYDLVKSEDVRTLLKFLEAQGINNYLDRISDTLNRAPSPPVSEESENSDDGGFAAEFNFREVGAPVAKLIPIMNSFINVPHCFDTWAAVLLNNESLKSYSANIYESYSCRNFD